MSFFVKKMSWTRFWCQATLILALLWLAGHAFASRYRIGVDEQKEKCLPGYSVYLIDLKDKNLKRGHLYAFSFQGKQMLKILTAIPNDKVEIDHTQKITVNGKVVGEGLYLADQLGYPDNHFYGKTVLKEGHYWFMGKSFNSFDSRYWGAVKEDQIIGRAYALF